MLFYVTLNKDTIDQIIINIFLIHLNIISKLCYFFITRFQFHLTTESSVQTQASRSKGPGGSPSTETEGNTDVVGDPGDRVLCLLPVDSHGDQLQECQHRVVLLQV